MSEVGRHGRIQEGRGVLHPPLSSCIRIIHVRAGATRPYSFDPIGTHPLPLSLIKSIEYANDFVKERGDKILTVQYTINFSSPLFHNNLFLKIK